ncbi:unnamed protein product, partial [Mycena citricolor]
MLGGIPVAVVVIVAAVVEASSARATIHLFISSSSAQGQEAKPPASAASAHASASSAVSAKLALGRFATATNSEFRMPIYPSTTDSSAFSSPTFVPSTSSTNSWPKDPFSPSSRTWTTMGRPPRIIANDPYLKGWKRHDLRERDTVEGGAARCVLHGRLQWHLDNSRSVKEASRRSRMLPHDDDTAWGDRTWEEIQNAAGTARLLSARHRQMERCALPRHAEMSAAYAIAYDWLYEMWSQDQKKQDDLHAPKVRAPAGLSQFTTGSGWWANNITGTGNCVGNGGLTLASLAISETMAAGVPEQLLAKTVPNAVGNVAKAVSPDGTWAETANYWYFGTTAHAEMASSLISATGSDYGLLDTNTDFLQEDGRFQFSTTPNSMFCTRITTTSRSMRCFNADMADAAEPWSMFWYNPSIKGAFWGTANLSTTSSARARIRASMRSAWTDNNALYVGIKASTLRFHQTHNDLDVGDFVL